MRKVIFAILLNTLLFSNHITAQKVEIFNQVRVQHDEKCKDFSTDVNGNIFYGGGQYVF